MCIVTERFIINAKMEMGFLGYRPKTVEEMDFARLKKITACSLLRLDNMDDAYFIGRRYNWIARRWKKIQRAMRHEKWKLSPIPYSTTLFKRHRGFYSNVEIVTNIFSEKCEHIFYDDCVKIESIAKVKNKDKQFEIVSTSDGRFVFSKEYISTLKKKKYCQKEKAIAEIFPIGLDDYKMVDYIVFDEKVLDKPHTLKVAKAEICEYLSREMISRREAVALAAMSTLALQRNIISRY